MTTRSRWLDWTPPRLSDSPPKPTEGAFGGFDGASATRFQNTKRQCSLEEQVDQRLIRNKSADRQFPEPAETNPPKLPKDTAVNYEAIYLALTVDAGTAEDLAAIGHHVDLNGFWVADEVTWLDRRCDRLTQTGADEPTYRAAVLVLVARIDELRRWHDGTSLPWTNRRLCIISNEPRPEPVTLSDGTVVTSVGRGIGRWLTAADYVLSHPALAASDLVLDVYCEQLAVLGIRARVELIQ